MHACLVIRHGAAQELGPTGRDEDRALTHDGRVDMERIAIGLAAATRPVEAVVTSPFRRAHETAVIVASALGNLPVRTEPALASGAEPEVMLAAVAAHFEGNGGGIAVVGHEPDLGRFISYALAGTTRSFHPLRKGAACLLELPALPRAGNASLEWALDPVHLRALAPCARDRRGASA